MLNTATGTDALAGNATGNNNTATGGFALWDNTTGNNNTALGASALFNNMTGSSNIAVGATAGTGVSTASNIICIGIPGANVNDSFYVANVFETSIDPDNLPVHIDFTGRLGTQSSSRRFKDDITSMNKASEAILSLRPVTFHYKNDAKARAQFGLVAEEVEKVNPDLIVRDKEGKPYSVRYDQVNAMLLNEFLKEHKAFVEQKRKLEAQAATIARLTKTLDTVLARLDQHDSKIQSVSDQIKMAQARQVVLRQP
jgi:trimeric autotransporter adhesin